MKTLRSHKSRKSINCSNLATDISGDSRSDSTSTRTVVSSLSEGTEHTEIELAPHLPEAEREGLQPSANDPTNNEAHQMIQPCSDDFTAEQAEELLETSFPVSMGAHTVSDEPSSSSDSDDGDYSLSTEDVEGVWKDWLKQQPKESIKIMSIMLCHNFINRFGLTKTGSAKETAFLLGVNEKTIRIWNKNFVRNGGTFSESKQGRHVRPYILDDEELRHKAATWVQSNSSIKGQPNMTASKFCDWVNTELLPNVSVPPGCPFQIKKRTATRWLHDLGFRPQSHKKGIYIDGHECTDITEYRSLYIRKLEILESTHLPPPPCPGGLTEFDVGNPSALKHLVLIYHDECIFHANEGQSTLWAEEGKVPIRPKTQGRGIMVSDFVTEYDGLLKLSDDEFKEAQEINPSVSQSAVEIIKYGAAGDGYWNNERFLKQVRKAITVAEFKYPLDKHTLVWLFDQSSGHCAYREDALNVNKMNVRPGGAQPIMRDTMWHGKIQKMTLDGQPKGMKMILEERGIDTTKMKAADMRLVLNSHHDFKYEKTSLEHLMSEKGHRCYYLPKFHCELNPIERVWGEAKRYTRAHCDYSFPGLERTVPIGLASVDVNIIRKYFRKCREYMQAYRDGKVGGDEIENAVKLYKSHRRIVGQVE